MCGTAYTINSFISLLLNFMPILTTSTSLEDPLPDPKVTIDTCWWLSGTSVSALSTRLLMYDL